jgi:hypothetical protein
MNIKGLIVTSSPETHKIFNCEVAVPSLKVVLDQSNEDQSLFSLMKSADYTNVIFMLNGNPFEVSLYKKDDKNLYANAKEISSLDLSLAPILKENNLVKKFLAEKQQRKPIKKNI